jgi:HAD superfamily hydrolase (TIGR01509 family)
MAPLLLPLAVLFDMDGTLTRPMLDFLRIKAEMGIGGRPILEALAEMHPESRAVAEAILLRHEEEAARNSQLNPGCHEVLAWLRKRNVPIGLITRNSRLSVTTVLTCHHLQFDVLITREHGRFKPDPHPLHLACRELKVAEKTCWMVGDGQYDIEAGRAAGMTTLWLSHGRARTFQAEPDYEVKDLLEVVHLLSIAGSA